MATTDYWDTTPYWTEVTTETLPSNSETRKTDWMGVASACIGFFGIFGNTLVVAVIFNYTKMRQKLTNIFIINQSMVDLVCSVLMVAHSMAWFSGHVQDSPAGWLFCLLWESRVILFSFLMSSTYNLMACNFERYLAIVHPIKHKQYLSRKTALLAVLLVWLIGPIYNFPLTVPTSTLKNNSCSSMTEWPSVLASQVSGAITFMVQYLLPILAIIFSYVRMAQVLRKKITTVGPQTGSGAQESRKANFERVQRNIIRTLAIVSACFVICWTGNQIFFLLFNLGYPVVFGAFYRFAVLAAFINSCINPVVYISQYEEFKRGLRKLFCCGKNSPGGENSSSVTAA